MVEVLRNNGVEQRPPFTIRNVLVANVIARIIDWKLGNGLNSEGHKLLRQTVVNIVGGTKTSGKDIFRIYQGANLAIEVDGQKYIPTLGPTIFIANHTHGGPMGGVGQFFEMVKEGYNARSDVEDEDVREPFLIAQRGLGKGKLIQYLSGMFYESVGRSLNYEIVAVPRFDKDGEIINGQNLKLSTVRRIINGASIWLPQGAHRDPDDLHFPEKATEFLKIVNKKDQGIQLVPVRSIPDSQGNIKVIFGPPVESGHVVASGGINYFSEKHIAPLR